MADALFKKVLPHLLDGILLVGQTVQEAGIDHLSVSGIRFLLNIAALDDLHNRNSELLCEVIVSLIVRRNRHNRTGSVAHHDIV